MIQDRPEKPDVNARLRFLAEASRLLSQSLDYEETLETVAHLAMPELGAWCIVDLLNEDGTIRRLAVCHPDPAKQALARELGTRYPPHVEDAVGLPAALRAMKPTLVSGVADDLLAKMATSDEHLRILRELGIGSFMVIPLSARGHILGSMTFISAEAGKRLTREDLEFAEDLASRCAMSMDNARLYQEARRALGEARAARAGIEAATRAKSEFLSSMSHELRTPLNAIAGYAEMLEMGIPGELTEAQHRQLNRIRESGEYLTSLVNGILDLAQGDAAAMRLKKEDIHVADIVESATAVVRIAAIAGAITLDVRTRDTSCAFVGDPGRTQQILINLLSNAIKFTPAGGRVEVTCGVVRQELAPASLGQSASGEWAWIRISDTGIGIPEEDQARAFDPFVQLDQAHTRTRGGTGLGLALSRKLAHAMGGDITLTSEVGRGSAFTLWLPSGKEIAPTQRRAAPRGELDGSSLWIAGRTLVSNMPVIVDSFVQRIRAELDLDVIPRLTNLQIQDHVGSFLADLGDALAAVAEAGTEPSDLLRDSSEIQRVVAERHGAQRCRLGWNEAAIVHEYRILAEEIVRVLTEQQPSLSGDRNDAIRILLQMLSFSERVALRSFSTTSSPGLALPREEPTFR